MRRKIGLLMTFLLLTTCQIAHAEGQVVEIFHIEKGKVMKEIAHNTEVQKVTKKMLQQISGVYSNISPLPKKGIMMKLPIDPPIQVQNKWYSDYADEVIVIFSEEDPIPYLLLWDDENQPHFFTTQFNAKDLFNALNYYPNFGQNKP